MTLSLSQVRVVDPILSSVVLGYRNAKFIGGRICPSVPVGARGGQVLQFGKEAFAQYNLRRAPGSATRRVDVGYLGKRFALVQDAIEGKLPIEHIQDAAQVPGIDLASRAVNLAMAIVTLALEIEQMQVVTDSSAYDANHKITLSGTDKWSDYATSQPGLQMDAYKEAVRQSTGVYPTLLTIGPKVFNVLKRHPVIRDQFKFTGAEVITEQMLAEYFGVEEVLVGKGVYWDDGQDKMIDIWGNLALLTYSPVKPAGQEEPSHSYTYTLTGSPAAYHPYWDNNSKSWIYPVEYDRTPVITCAEAGFLVSNVV